MCFPKFFVKKTGDCWTLHISYLLFSLAVILFLLAFPLAMKFKLIACIIFLASAAHSLLQCTDKTRNILISPVAVIIACILSACVFLFYGSYVLHDSIPHFVINILQAVGINHRWFCLISGTLGCMLSFPGVCFFSQLLIDRNASVFRFLQRYAKHYLLLLSIHVIAFLPIMLADFYYIDDLGRAIYGYSLIGDFSRYTDLLLEVIFHGNSWLSDTSPLSQLLSLPIISFAELIVLFLLSEETAPPPVWSILGVLPIGLSPYFLSCLSYKYDAPFMALSVLVSILPLLYRRKKAITYMFAIYIGTIVMCTTYQVSSGIFPMLTVFLCFLMWLRKAPWKEILVFAFKSAAGYILGLLCFIVLIHSRAQDSYLDISFALKNIPLNLTMFTKQLWLDLPQVWQFLMILIGVCAGFSFIRSTKHRAVFSIPFTILVMVCLYMLAFGVSIAFTMPLTTPRAYYGIGVLIALFGTSLLLTPNQFSPVKIAPLCLSWLFFIFSFTYGNALERQAKYTDFRTEIIISDLNEYDLIDRTQTFQYQLIGSEGHHKMVENTAAEYPVLSRLVPVLLSDSTQWGWGSYYLEEYYGLDAELTEICVPQDSAHLVVDSYYHSIYSDGSRVLIVVHQNTDGNLPES